MASLAPARAEVEAGAVAKADQLLIFCSENGIYIYLRLSTNKKVFKMQGGRFSKAKYCHSYIRFFIIN